MSSVYYGQTINRKSGIVTTNGAIYGYASSVAPYGYSGGAWHESSNYNYVNTSNISSTSLCADAEASAKAEATAKAEVEAGVKAACDRYDAEEDAHYWRWRSEHQCSLCDGSGRICKSYNTVH